MMTSGLLKRHFTIIIAGDLERNQMQPMFDKTNRNKKRFKQPKWMKKDHTPNPKKNRMFKQLRKQLHDQYMDEEMEEW